MLAGLKPLMMSGKEVLPVVEGGKGISVSNGESSGAWAAAGGVGTFSGVNADYTDDAGNIIPQIYYGKTRRERHEELLAFSIKGGIHQARVAHEMSNGEGRIHMNVLWEMGGCERVLHGILEGSKGLVHGVTCGAGMPYRVAEISASYGVYYYPIVSSARAFRALWLRAYKKFPEWLGGVVYEDPWLAGGHNGLSNSEDPLQPQDPYERIVELRKVMTEFGQGHVPIVMAGGVWWLKEWTHFLDNPEVGPVAFQFGTRPLLTKESPISDAWKQRLLHLKHGDVYLNKFSPTGFYSSAVRNPFLQDLTERSERQIPYSTESMGQLNAELQTGPRGRVVYVSHPDKLRAEAWVKAGFNKEMRTPDNTLIYVTPESSAKIVEDQINCMGCLSACAFSNWSQHEDRDFTTGRKADPRSFCIQKTLQRISHSDEIDTQLMFAGHNAYRFADDPWYSNGFVPTVKQLVERIATGE
jgi:NAD(P)H-dependent flavin oxidoreductase YrpB (nitropropane dioxygenase family)